MTLGNLSINDPRAVCATEPFNAICTEFTKERNAFIERCVAEDATVPAGICDSATTFVCTDNPFPEICDKEQEYRDAQQAIVTACEAGNCLAVQLVQFCTDNPYHALCGASAYDVTRDNILATCGTATKHELCHVAIVPVCTNNPFDIVCQGDTTYEDERTSAVTTCNQGFIPLTSERCQNAITAVCVGAGITNNPVLCDGVEADVAVTGTCNANRFDSACNDIEIYKEQRRVFCLASETASDNRCPAVVASTCMDNPFHGLCQTGTTYDAPRATAITDCIAVPQGALCDVATTHTCTDNPFHEICLGVSAATYASARNAAVTNCGDGTNVITTQICIDAALQTCEGDSADIFHATCIAAAAQTAQVAACGANPPADSRCYRAEQINACAEGIETARCAGVGTGDIATCAADPFATACVVAGSTFAPYLTEAQNTRYTYCSADVTGRADITLCTSYKACFTAFTNGDALPTNYGCGANFDTTVRDTCMATPFNSQCAAVIYNSNKQDFCSTNANGVNNLFDPKCTADYRDDTARDTFCKADPFHDGCKSNAAYATLREGLCTGDTVVTPHASCVTTALVTSPRSGAEPTLIPRPGGSRPPPQNLTRYADSFLSVTITQDHAIAPALEAIVRTVTIPEVRNSENVVTQAASTTFERPEMGAINVGRRGGAGTEANRNRNLDGYAFFTLIKPGDAEANLRTSQHAVILPTTNLGAPLTEAPATAVWPGHFSTTENPTQTAVNFYIDWDLKQINFSNDAGTGLGLHVAPNRPETRPAIAIAAQLRLSVKFNEKGQLYDSFASIRDGTNDHGLLRVIGFIGQEGVVAAFVDRENTGVDGNKNTGNAGGFTASNPDHPDYEEAAVAADVKLVETGVDSNASLVNYEDWLESSVEPKYDRTAPRQSEFLQTNNRRIPGLVNGQNAQVADFNSVTNFRSVLARGDAINGFAVHTEAGNHYAGVFNTASLGAPIDVAGLTAQNVPSALWRGYLVAQSGTATIRHPFDLTVSFTSPHEGQAGELDGTVRNDIRSLSSGLLYTIDGRFNPRGVISGTILRGLISAPLSGIIGQTGAIGVFASNEENNKFAGGFVAVPYQVPTKVTHNDVWVASHEAGVYGLFPTPRAENHWLQGGVTSTNPALVVNGQSVAGITARDGGILRMSTATWKLASIGTDASDAVAFYTGIYKGRRQFYSGVTSRTDLGAPVQSKSGSATWVGQLSARQNVGTAAAPVIQTRYGDIALTVAYTQTGGSITGGLSANPLTSPGYTYQVRGRFNEDGLVEGNVNTVSSRGTEAGFLSGLIGQGGIVGAFVAPNVAGGFVARPGKPNFVATETTYQDWLYATQVRGEALVSVPHNASGRWNEVLLTSTTAPYHISYGHSRQDDGARRRSYTVAVTLGKDANNVDIPTPAGLVGGYSYMASLWNQNGAAVEGPSLLQRTFHAGIHPNTNVGRPLPLGSYRPPGFTQADRTPVVATWRGHAHLFGNKKWNYTSGATTVDQSDTVRGGTNFNLSINYSNRNFYSSGAIGGFLTLNGYWDERGIMTGTATNSLANYPDGTITGLIGRKGAIGVFISNEGARESTYGWTGGFIACPTIKANGSGRCAD